ncbi:MAG: hypothetical protein JJ979_02630 [Roseibium sp.]|nr:hypothetical protein [Roseibium sp.]
MTIVAIDFDGTIVEHEYPRVGAPVPGALDFIKQFQEKQAKLVLWTMRSGQTLYEATEYLLKNGVELYGVNVNPDQKDWTQSPKAYAHMYIDDAAVGCPLIRPRYRRPYVDWSIVGPTVLREIERLGK